MKLGISCRGIIQKYGYAQAFALCKESGFDAVEINLQNYGNRLLPTDIYNASTDQFDAYFTHIREQAEAVGLEISSTHGRDRVYTPDEAQCAYTRWACERDLRATRLLGAPACVIHSVFNSDWPDGCDDEAFIYQKNTECFQDLIPFAEANGVKIALETFGRTIINGESTIPFFGHAHQMRKQFDLLNTTYKTVCVDTGHTNEAHFRGAVTPADMIRTMGKDVSVLHLHDNNGTADLHLDPIFYKEGCVDWKDVFDALDEVVYSGVYNFELKWGYFGDVMADAVRFRGKFLRYFVENKGRVG